MPASAFTIGGLRIDSRVLMAPMAGITDLPMRRICRHYGAGLTTSEMVTGDSALWRSRKSSTRLITEPQTHPISMQIVGAEPHKMAEAAKACVDLGAEIVDINMGCPAKKVCKKLAGSALMQDPDLVQRILRAVVGAVDVPVTLKTRTGYEPSQRNGAQIAKIAELEGIQAITVHGRTRACRFNGVAEYDTIAEIADAVTIPVIVNGDIDGPAKALFALRQSGARAVMIGRAALGRPWILSAVRGALEGTEAPPEPSAESKRELILMHLNGLYALYGEEQGLRIARKHFAWYCTYLKNTEQARKEFNSLTTNTDQLQYVKIYFQRYYSNEENAA